MKFKAIPKNILLSLTFLIFSHLSFAMDEPRPYGLRTPGTVRILSVHGGGIRGVIPAIIVERIEEQLNRSLKKQDPNKAIHIADYFDVLAGTSTGGIIVLGLGTKDKETGEYYTASKIKKLYKDSGADIFDEKWRSKASKGLATSKFDSTALGREAKNYFSNIKLSEMDRHTIIPAYHMQSNDVHIFDSSATKKGKADFFVKDVALSTAAAPTYFDIYECSDTNGDNHSFIDGGVFANDPSYIALLGALKTYPEAKQIELVSIGTGKAPKVDRSQALKSGGKVQWASEAPSIMMNGAYMLTELSINHMVGILRPLGITVDYKPIQVTIGDKLKAMDKVKNIPSLSGLAWKFAQTDEDDINAIVQRIETYLLDKTLAEKRTKQDSFSYIKLATKQQLQLEDEEFNLSGYKIEKINTIEEVLHDYKTKKGPELPFKILNLSNNNIGYESVDDLIKLLISNKNIKVLILNGNPLNQQGLQYLLKRINEQEHCINILELGNSVQWNSSSLQFIVNFFSSTLLNLSIYLGDKPETLIKECSKDDEIIMKVLIPEIQSGKIRKKSILEIGWQDQKEKNRETISLSLTKKLNRDKEDKKKGILGDKEDKKKGK